MLALSTNFSSANYISLQMGRNVDRHQHQSVAVKTQLGELNTLSLYAPD
jgi:hypothetical protein